MSANQKNSLQDYDGQLVLARARDDGDFDVILALAQVVDDGTVTFDARRVLTIVLDQLKTDNPSQTFVLIKQQELIDVINGDGEGGVEDSGGFFELPEQSPETPSGG